MENRSNLNADGSIKWKSDTEASNTSSDLGTNSDKIKREAGEPGGEINTSGDTPKKGEHNEKHGSGPIATELINVGENNK